MSKKRFICPECGSDNTVKDRHQFGGDSGDRTCSDCGYTASCNSFESSSKTKNNDEE